jgi:enamine deaminase RidA (YjgF/YER057c/UK114 family)
MPFQRAFSGAPWEPKIGYCRAVRAGNHIFVSGTAPVDDRGATFAPGDAYAQTKRCFEIIEKALKSFGADLSCVVRTHLFVTDITRWEEYGRAHGDIFRAHPPASLMVEIKSLIDPAMLVEVEVDAITESGSKVRD